MNQCLWVRLVPSGILGTMVWFIPGVHGASYFPLVSIVPTYFILYLVIMNLSCTLSRSHENHERALGSLTYLSALTPPHIGSCTMSEVAM